MFICKEDEFLWAAVSKQGGGILQDQVDLGVADSREEIENLLNSDAWRKERDRFRITRIRIVDLGDVPTLSQQAIMESATKVPLTKEDKHRLVRRMIDKQNKSPEEVAEVLQVTVGTVKRWYKDSTAEEV